MSHGDEVRPVSAVSVLGRVTGDATVFKQVASDTEITIDKESDK